MTEVQGGDGISTSAPEFGNNRSPEVISGADRGFVRSAPEKVKGLLLKSLSEGAVSSGEQADKDDILQRAVDLTVNFGQLTVKSGRRRHGLVEEYDSVTTIIKGNGLDQNITIRTSGLLDSSQLPDEAEQVATAVGNILPEPTVEISFKKHASDDTIETHRFVFGRNGTSILEQSIDDKEGYRVTQMTPEQAREYLSQHLPSIEEDADGTKLSEGKMWLPEDRIRAFFNDIRLGRLGSGNRILDQVVQAKRERYGYESVMYLPQDYFNARNREGEFFSIDFPQAVIPEDVIEHASMEERIRKIIIDSGQEIDEQNVEDMLLLLDGLPGGLSNIGVLIKKADDSVLPEMKKVPTTIFDKTALYLLQHQDAMRDAVTNYRKMCEAMGKVPATAFAIEIAIKSGLLESDRVKARKIFEDFATTRFDGADMTTDMIQGAITQSYDSLANFGDTLRRDVYSDEDIAYLAQAE